MRMAHSFASPPVDRNIAFDRLGGSSAASFSARRITAGERWLECRCATVSDASRIAFSTSGLACPRIALIWPDVKSRISRPSVV